MGEKSKKASLAGKIEHTILRAETKLEDIKQLCKEAIEYNFAAVCIPPYYVQDAASLLKDSGVKVVTVIGFPLGYSGTFAKVEETKRAIQEGADEIDVVINIAAFKNKKYPFVLNDLQSVATTARLQNKKVKAIIETSLLNEEEIKKACEICIEAGVDFVKTSTGFSKSGGATVEAITLLKTHLPKKIKIKASGGIKTKAFAEELINAGADRIGSTSGIQIISE